MIFLYEYIPTVLTIPTAYCMETEFEGLWKLRLDLVCAEKIISGVRRSGYHVIGFESIVKATKK